MKKKPKDEVVLVRESSYCELSYGNLDDMIEQLNDLKAAGYHEIETDYYGHDEGFDLLKVKIRPENEEEKQARLYKEEEAIIKQKKAREKRRAEFEKLKKEFGNE